MATVHKLTTELVSFTLPVLRGGGEFVLRGKVLAGEEQSPRAAIMMLDYITFSGDRIPNPLGWALSRELGRGYRYLPSGGAAVSPFLIQLQLAETIAFVEVSCRAWRPVGDISIEGMRLDVLRRALPSVTRKPGVPGPVFDRTTPRHTISIAGKPVPVPASYEAEPNHTYSLSFTVTANESPSQAFVAQPHFVREDGTSIKSPVKGFGQSPRFGTFCYLHPGENVIKFTVPAECKRLRFTLYPWAAREGQVEVVTELRLLSVPLEALSKDIITELNDLIKAADPEGVFLCIYTGTKRIGEGNRANRSMMFAREAAKLGITTIYTYSPTEGETEYGRTNDHLLQVPLPVFPAIAGIIAERAPSRAKLFLGSMPDFEQSRHIGLFRQCGWTFVYECRDEWEEFSAVGSGAWFDEVYERFATQQASKVFCVSPYLQAKMRRYTVDPSKVLVSPNATTDEFLAIRAVSHSAARLRFSLGPPITPTIGYFGHLTEQWFDWGALLRAAHMLPNANFQVIGFDIPEIELPNNIHYLGSKTHGQIMEIAKDWDVGLIPFKLGRLSRAVDPIKVYEYLALGLKVVAIPMGSLETFPMTFCYNEFGLAESIEKALAFQPSASDWSRVDAVLRRASWRLRLLDLMKESGVTWPSAVHADVA